MRNLSLLFPAVLLTACQMVSGNGDIVQEPRDLSDFDTVISSANIDAEISGGAEGFSVMLECDRNLLPYIVTAVDSGELEIRVEDDVWLEPSKVCTAFVEMPAVLAVETHGSGDLVAGDVGRIQGITTTGSGDARVAGIDTDRLTITTSGSGDVIANGDAEQLRVATSGSGDVRAKGLTAGTAEVRTSGSGDVFLTVTGSVDARTSGSGDIHLHGNPKSVDRHSSGSGDIVVHRIGRVPGGP